MSRRKELNADPKAIQRIEFVGQLKKKIDNNGNATDGGNDQFFSVLKIFKKSQINQVEIFWRKCDSLIKDDKLRRSKSN